MFLPHTSCHGPAARRLCIITCCWRIALISPCFLSALCCVPSPMPGTSVVCVPTRHPSSTSDVITLCIKCVVSPCAKPWPLEQHHSLSTHRHTVSLKRCRAQFTYLLHLESSRRLRPHLQKCVNSFKSAATKKKGVSLTLSERFSQKKKEKKHQCFFLLFSQLNPFITSKFCFII